MKFTTFQPSFRTAHIASILAGGLIFAPAAPAQEEEETAATEETAAAAPVETVPVSTGEAPANPEATELDAIEVTGSRIKRTDYETAQPVITISREEIKRTGLTSVGDLLQNLPQAGPALNTLFNNGGNGSTNIDLRTLGSQRVLVLVNGKRWVGGVSPLSTSSVDLNTVPISIIERIDILKDGASAVYGSDAVAGVVNVITRKNVQGSDMDGQLQISDQGDGAIQSYSFSNGSISGKTSTFISLGYVKQEAIGAGDRAISSVPRAGTGLTRGSAGTDLGFFIFVPTAANEARYGETNCPSDVVALVNPVAPVDPNPAGSPGVLPIIDPPGETNPLPNQVPLCVLVRRPDRTGRPTDNSTNTFTRFNQNIHSYNFAPDNYLQTPQERTNIFGQFSQQLSDTTDFSAEVLYNIRKSSQELAPFPLQGGRLLGGLFRQGGVHIQNPFNPFQQNVGQPHDTALTGLGAYFRRLNEQGRRNFSQNVDTIRLGGAFQGSFDDLGDLVNIDYFNRLFSWDFSYNFTNSSNRNIEEGIQNYDRVIRATGDPANCVPANDGCVPLNVFGGPGTITPAMIKYISYTGISSQRNRSRAWAGNIGAELVNLPYGPLGFATGFEYRQEDFAANPDPLVAAGRSTTNAQTPTVGGFDVKEVYVEFAAPLLEDFNFDQIKGLGNISWLKGVPLVKELELTLAGRYSDYGELGSKPSGKFGLRYKPIDDLLVRATLSEAFRAPNVTELYLGVIESFPTTLDPCSNYNSALRNNEAGIANVRRNCAADGVPSSYTQSTTQIRSQFGGNRNLKPETARSFTTGLVYSPSFLPDFNAYVDFYDIEIEEVITFVGAPQVLGLCYRAPPEQRTLCERVERIAGTGALSKLSVIPGNLQKLKVAGVDLNFDYIIPVRGILDRYKLWPGLDLGSYKLQLVGAYVDERSTSTPSAAGGTTKLDIAGLGTGIGAVPHWKASSQLLWTHGQMEANWDMRYVHHTTEICDDGAQALTGLFAPRTDPVLSLEQYGLCDGRKTLFNVPNVPFNKVGSVTYHNVRFSYNLPNIDSKVFVGANNIFGKDTPVTLSSSSGVNFDVTLHELEDIQPYLGFLKTF